MANYDNAGNIIRDDSASRALQPSSMVINAVAAPLDGPSGPSGYEASRGRRGLPATDCDAGYQRQALPETLLGVHCPSREVHVNDVERAVEGFSSDTPEYLSIINTDFFFVGTVGQVRAAIETLYAQATFNITRTAGVVAGVNATITAPVGGFPHSVGVRLEWGVGLTSYAPFAMPIATSGFVTPLGSAVADRNITLRARNVNGGELFIPWAQRVVPGMTMGQNQIASAAVGSTITVTALPAAVAAAFSVVAQFLTAFSPLTAQWAQINGIFDCTGR